MNWKLLARLLTAALLGSFPAAAWAQGLLEFEYPPIDYHQQPAANRITQLQEKILTGAVQLDFHRRRGYLDAFLEQLDISETTQALVFSKSSVQLRRISPARPRAMYFDENIYVAWVQGGDVLEIIVSDVQLGSVFYTLAQREVPLPRFQRDRGQCLQCHANRRTKRVPGPVVRSLFTGPDGQPIFNFGNFVSDHTSPLHERWGGYYVTGIHGTELHMGNMLADRRQPYESLDYESGANVSDLSWLVNTRPYLTRHSDLVALMVLEHQTQMQNLITQARYEEIRGKHYDTAFRSDRPLPSDYTRRRVTRAAEQLLAYMLFVNEYPLRSRVSGTSGFSEQFSAKGPHDQQRRSLYQLDLKRRLFKYPLSYMVYTEAFRQLPPMTGSHLARRLGEVLSANSSEDEFAHLDLATRRAILEILQQTAPELITSP